MPKAPKKAAKMCFDKVLPWEEMKPHRMRVNGAGKKSAISPIGKRWVNGSTLRIRFIGGTEAQHELVKKHAVEWTEHANLNFEFGDDPNAEIRISFDADAGAWSYVGTDNQSIPTHAATMNLGWQDKGVILHEFGHMLGLGHEHQNPDGGIVWNEQAVIDALAGPPNFWDEAKTRHNVLRKYSADQVHGTNFDPDSVMLYQFPGSWTQNMPQGTQGNDDLSATDAAFIAGAKMYPGRTGGGTDPVEATELPVFAPVRGTIAVAGEEDLFTFQVTDAGTYVVETNGGDDLYLSLFGPGDSSALIGEDDDSGHGRNPRVEAVLTPGLYFVSVRHFDPAITGDYSIHVWSKD